jgi:hypothetical protein
LKEKLDELEEKEEIIISNPKFSYLYNLKLAYCPQPSQICDCDENFRFEAGKRLTYKECCESVDKSEKKKLIEEIK